LHREFELRDSRAKKWNIAGYESAPALDGAARERERKEGGRGCGRANDRFWWSKAEGARGGEGAGAGDRGPGGHRAGGKKTDEVSRPLDW